MMRPRPQRTECEFLTDADVVYSCLDGVLFSEVRVERPVKCQRIPQFLLEIVIRILRAAMQGHMNCGRHEKKQ